MTDHIFSQNEYLLLLLKNDFTKQLCNGVHTDIIHKCPVVDAGRDLACRDPSCLSFGQAVF